MEGVIIIGFVILFFGVSMIRSISRSVKRYRDVSDALAETNGWIRSFATVLDIKAKQRKSSKRYWVQYDAKILMAVSGWQTEAVAKNVGRYMYDNYSDGSEIKVVYKQLDNGEYKVMINDESYLQKQKTSNFVNIVCMVVFILMVIGTGFMVYVSGFWLR